MINRPNDVKITSFFIEKLRFFTSKSQELHETLASTVAAMSIFLCVYSHSEWWTRDSVFQESVNAVKIERKSLAGKFLTNLNFEWNICSNKT